MVMSEETSVDEARLIAEKASRLEEKVSQYQNALKRAAAAVEKAKVQVREATDAFTRAQAAEQADRSFPVSPEETAKKERESDEARQEMENARSGYQRLVNKLNLIGQKVRQYEGLSSQVTATLGGKKRQRSKTHKRKTRKRKTHRRSR